MFDTSLNWVKYCCFRFCTNAKSPLVSSEKTSKSFADILFFFLALSKTPLKAFSTLLACLLKPSLTTVSDQAKYSLSIIAFIFGRIATAAWSSINLPSGVFFKSLFANAVTSRSILSNVATRVL